VKQDFIVKWVLTIEFSLLQIVSPQILYKETITRYSPCCPLPLGDQPKDGDGDGEEEEKEDGNPPEDGEKDKQQLFFARLDEIEGIDEAILARLALAGINSIPQLAVADTDIVTIKGVSKAKLTNYFIPAARLFVQLQQQTDNGELNAQDIEVLAKVYQGKVAVARRDSAKTIGEKISRNRIRLPADYSAERLEQFLKKLKS
jgi:hypothetical protein